jgi:hypothetical protein
MDTPKHHDFENLDRLNPQIHYGIETRWAILETPPQSIDDLIHSSFTTDQSMSFQFEDGDSGKTVYFCCCWVNIEGARGPWSEIKSAVIS